MPITITEPGGSPPFNLPFEPGVAIRAITDHVGPLTSSAVWTIEAWKQTDSEHFALRRKYAWLSNTLQKFAWEPGINDPAADGEGLGSRPIQGDLMTLRVQLDDPTSGFHEQAQVNVQFGEFDQSWRYTGVGTATAQIPPQLTADASAAATQTTKVFTAGVSQVSIPVADLVLHPPLGLLKLSISPGHLEGVGRILLFGQPVDVAYGLWWSIVEVPIGFGLREGVVNEFQQRLIQLRVVHNVAGQLLCSELLDANYAEVLFTWKEFKPYAIDFDITPGVVLDVRLLIL